jgi:hypothetical protein
MYPHLLKKELRQAALNYALSRDLPIDDQWSSAIIFANLADNFSPDSFAAIEANAEWSARTRKQHNRVANSLEMQSSNSSDGLLMNIFCHPKLGSWKGVVDLFGFTPREPTFGFMPRVAKQGTEGDETEIDMAIGDCFVEAKLTEAGFTEKPVADVLMYSDLATHFHVDSLSQVNGLVRNYQIIRNLLAAIQHDRKHVLLCDARRPDLVREYFATVMCMKDIVFRERCRVVFWQDIARVSGKGLRSFLNEKYGIF